MSSIVLKYQISRSAICSQLSGDQLIDIEIKSLNKDWPSDAKEIFKPEMRVPIFNIVEECLLYNGKLSAWRK